MIVIAPGTKINVLYALDNKVKIANVRLDLIPTLFYLKVLKNVEDYRYYNIYNGRDFSINFINALVDGAKAMQTMQTFLNLKLHNN